jgi:hypothetical protein
MLAVAYSAGYFNSMMVEAPGVVTTVPSQWRPSGVLA